MLFLKIEIAFPAKSQQQQPKVQITGIPTRITRAEIRGKGGKGWTYSRKHLSRASWIVSGPSCMVCVSRSRARA